MLFYRILLPLCMLPLLDVCATVVAAEVVDVVATDVEPM